MNVSNSNKTYSHDFYASAFYYNDTNLKEYTPLIHGILSPVHDGLILFILWISYKVHRAVYRTLSRLGSRHINTIILANIVRKLNSIVIINFASSNTFCLEAHSTWFMKGIFNPYVLSLFDKKLIS